MGFPAEIVSNVVLSRGAVTRKITLHSGLTVILGPNGAGKTQHLRGMRNSLQEIVAGKKVCFASAGRIGRLENYRADYDGRYGGQAITLSF